jgi:hypothetical protein
MSCCVPSHLVVGRDIMLCPFVHHSGMRHNVAVPPPPHLDLGHDLVLRPFVLWDATSCCIPSHLMCGMQLMLHPFVYHSGM